MNSVIRHPIRPERMTDAESMLQATAVSYSEGSYS